MPELMQQMGLIAYMQQYPLNPISLIGGIVILGIIILFIAYKLKKGQSEKYLLAYPGSALVSFEKLHPNDGAYGDNIRPLELNGQPAHWFFVKPNIGGMYLKPGRNLVVVYAQWADLRALVKPIRSSLPKTLELIVDPSGLYSLEYYIPEDRYIFNKVATVYKDKI
jgi:hypothetical protein